MSAIVTPPAAAAAAPGSGGDVWAEIGGLFDQRAFKRRINALTNPGAYSDNRDIALLAIKTASETAYKTAYKGYEDAGLSSELAKENAMMSAKSEYANQLRVFNLMYNQGTDAIFTGSAANKGTMAIAGTLAQATPRARRAPARRSSTTSTAASRSAAAKRGAATKRKKAAAKKKK